MISVPKVARGVPLHTLNALYLSGALLHLYTNNILPGPNSQIGDFTEATFTGYAAPTLTLTAAVPNYNRVGQGLVFGGDALFTITGGSPQTVIGYYITDSGNVFLIGAERFDQPFTFDLAAQLNLAIDSSFGLGDTQLDQMVPPLSADGFTWDSYGAFIMNGQSVVDHS